MAYATVTIAIDYTGKIVDPDPISTYPDAYLIFMIENHHDKKHTVSIHPVEFKKKHSEPDFPVHLFAIDSAEVEKGDTGVIVLHVKGKEHFKDTKKPKKHDNKNGKVFKYKYTIRATGLTTLDPQIEINN